MDNLTRISVLTILLVSCTVLHYVAGESAQDFINCDSKPSDHLLMNKTVDRSYKFLRVISEDVPYSTPDGSIIHCIKAIDLKRDGNAAHVSITSGGIGHNYVTVHFESQRNHGIHFNLTIQGRNKHSQDFINCDSKPSDHLLFNKTVNHSYKYLRVVSEDVPYSTPNGSIIHCIKAIDLKRDGNAADVTIKSGGLGHNYVNLHFKSQRNHGIHFNLTIQGSEE